MLHPPVGELPAAAGGLQGSRAAEAESLRGWWADLPAYPPFIQEIQVLCLAAEGLGLLVKAFRPQDNGLGSASPELDSILSLCSSPDHAWWLALHSAFPTQLPQSMMEVRQEHLPSCPLASNVFIVLEMTKGVVHYDLITDSQKSGILGKE